MQSNQDDFKVVLKSAKKRMKSGYWTNFIKRKQNDIEKAKENGEAVEPINNYYKKLAKNSATLVDNSYDEKMYEKVCQMLDNDECVINPISVLIDKEHIKTLSYNDQQRYILKLTEIYRRLVERYNIEKQLKEMM